MVHALICPVTLCSTMSFMDEIRKIPPVTRFLCGSSLGITLPVILQVVAPYKFVFVRQLVTQKWEVSIVSFVSALCL